MTMISWAKYFDHIYSIGYVKNDISKLNSELKRIGILDSGIYSHEYSISSILIDNIKDKFYDIYYNKYCTNEHYYGFDVTLSHFKVIKEAYELGYGHILIIEDDSIFRKDIDEIESIIKHIPQDYALCWLNWMAIDADWHNLLVEYDNWFWKSKFLVDDRCYMFVFSASSYCLDRKGMKFIIDIIESMKVTNIDNMLIYLACNIDNCYISRKKISIQVNNGIAMILDDIGMNIDSIDDFCL